MISARRRILSPGRAFLGDLFRVGPIEGNQGKRRSVMVHRNAWPTSAQRAGTGNRDCTGRTRDQCGPQDG